MAPSRARVPLAVILLTLVPAVPASGQARLTSPKEFFGFNLGDDYQLANYQKISAYWRRLDQESDRIMVREIGTTAEGRSMVMAVVSAPENLRSWQRYQEISRRLALVEVAGDEEARALAKQGRAVVWIDGGLHASEVLGVQQLAETVWQMVSGTDEETTRILNDVIILFVHANPDGNDLTADWYNRNPVPERRGNAPGLPRLYQKYIGHDNNRDFFASTQPETEAMNRVMYHEWLPQIVYNHHQTGPAGTVMFAPPFRDPFNYNFDPLIVVQLDLVAAAMHSRFQAEGKAGVTMRSGSSYSTWWNGGLRTTAYFHNMIGILTETIGHPTPIRIPFTTRTTLARGDLPNPIQPQEWHFRQSVDYSVTANKAVLDVASRFRETFLFNIYRAGKNSIERGGRDSWTVTPRRAAQANDAFERANGRRGSSFDPYREVLHRPELRDPRGYIIPANQPDFLTTIKFVNALREANVTVHRATAAFEVGGRSYPAGSFVVFTAQPFRPHVLDMFEPQDHPDDFAYPGAAPTPPYDNAGWTLAYQMGVHFERVLDGFTGPFERLTGWNVSPAPGTVTSVPRASGYLTSHQVNDAFEAVNRLLAAREEVYRIGGPVQQNGKTWLAGSFYVAAKGTTAAALGRIAAETGVSFEATASRPGGNLNRLRQPRVALMDVYGGSMTAGWTRWIMEQFDFAFERTFPPRIDEGNLNARYDVLILPDGVLPGIPDTAFNRLVLDSVEATLPPEYRRQRGPVTEKTLAEIGRFAENGGTVIAIGRSSAALANYLRLPIYNHLVENGEPLPRTRFYVPGSVVRAEVDVTHPLAAGMPASVDVFFDHSPVFRLGPDAAARGIRRVAWYGSKNVLRSGWAWGQAYLDGGAAAIDAPVGKGRAFLFGPEILQRAQPHGTFKFLFNAIYYDPATVGRATS